MSKSLNAASVTVFRVFRHSLIALVVLILGAAAAAQTSTTTSDRRLYSKRVDARIA